MFYHSVYIQPYIAYWCQVSKCLSADCKKQTALASGTCQYLRCWTSQMSRCIHCQCFLPNAAATRDEQDLLKSTSMFLQTEPQGCLNVFNPCVNSLNMHFVHQAHHIQPPNLSKVGIYLHGLPIGSRSPHAHAEHLAEEQAVRSAQPGRRGVQPLPPHRRLLPAPADAARRRDVFWRGALCLGLALRAIGHRHFLGAVGIYFPVAVVQVAFAASF